MKKYWIYLLFLVLTGFLAFLFKDSFTRFFFADDFFHIILSRSESLLGAFNIFEPAAKEYYIYRPLTTQLFWTVGETLFGLTPLPYHVINFFFYGVNIILAYLIGKLVTKSSRIGTVAAIIYALSGSHFYRLFFLSTFQDTVMATLVMTTLLLYARGSKIAFLTFILSLTAKETAVTTPAVLFAYDLLLFRKFKPSVIIYGVIAILYFLAHKYFFGFYQGGIYAYEFGLRNTLTNYIWYYFWSLGLPEDFINVGVLSKTFFSGGQIFQTYGLFGQIIFYLFLLLQVSVLAGLSLWLRLKKSIRPLLFALTIFIAFVLPVGFFPFHKFAINLAAPLFGIALFLALLISRYKWLTLFTLIILMILLSLTIEFNTANHWTSKRSRLANDIITQIKEKYPSGIDKQTLYFRNNLQYRCKIDPGEQKNSSEMAYSLSYRDALDVFYPHDSFEVYFEDFDHDVHCDTSVSVIDGCRLLRTIKTDRDHCPSGL